jgi:hypothetical protein
MKVGFIVLIVLFYMTSNSILGQSTSPIGTWRLTEHKVDIFDSISNNYSPEKVRLDNFESLLIFEEGGSLCQIKNSEKTCGNWKLSRNGKKLTIWVGENKVISRRKSPIDFDTTFKWGECIPEIYKGIEVTDYCGTSVYKRIK